LSHIILGFFLSGCKALIHYLFHWKFLQSHLDFKWRYKKQHTLHEAEEGQGEMEFEVNKTTEYACVVSRFAQSSSGFPSIPWDLSQSGASFQGKGLRIRSLSHQARDKASK
jgi:hypothetical protein